MKGCPGVNPSAKGQTPNGKTNYTPREVDRDDVWRLAVGDAAAALRFDGPAMTRLAASARWRQ